MVPLSNKYWRFSKKLISFNFIHCLSSINAHNARNTFKTPKLKTNNFHLDPEGNLQEYQERDLRAPPAYLKVLMVLLWIKHYVYSSFKTLKE